MAPYSGAMFASVARAYVELLDTIARRLQYRAGDAGLAQKGGERQCDVGGSDVASRRA